MTILRPLAAKLAALAILAAIMAIPCVTIFAFAAALQEKQRQITERSAQLDRLEAVARYRPRIDTPDHGEAAKHFAAWFLPETDPGLAAANLQDSVRSLAQAHGVEITRAGNAAQETMDGVAYAGISLDMTGPVEGLHALFGSIDAAQPFLIIQQVALQAEAGGGDPRYDPIPLYVTLEIRAALAPGTPAGEEAP